MKLPKGSANGLMHGFAAAVLCGLLGCVGYVDGGYEGVVTVPAPDIYIWGGGYERGRDVHEYSQRGRESREAAHAGRRDDDRRRR